MNKSEQWPVILPDALRQYHRARRRRILLISAIVLVGIFAFLLILWWGRQGWVFMKL